MIVLDDRLAAVEEMVRPGVRVADVGTDHGYLIASLLQSGKAVFGYACDIHRQPLEKAAETLEKYGLTQRVQLLLGDGLKGLASQQVDDVIIAGMGGDMILHILDEARWEIPTQRFILQPMTKVHELRAGLYQRGYEILQERAAQAKGFVYTVMQVRWSGEQKTVADLFARVGLLPQDPSPAALAYLNRQADSVRAIGAGLEKSNTNRDKTEKYYRLAEEIEEICRKCEEKG
ncbi:MAG: class I SAM-dependent methyltransferase [Oscillospiraceae bacterium]|nr:class I SAM-dependent methyltransferase [Oscillospiraceae bacterium]